MTNLLPIEMHAARAASAMSSVRNSKVSENDVISALNGSKRCRAIIRMPTNCTNWAVAKIAIAFCQRIPKSSAPIP